MTFVTDGDTKLIAAIRSMVTTSELQSPAVFLVYGTFVKTYLSMESEFFVPKH
jgi:hypothetical protein